MIRLPLETGDGIVWWDELLIHAREAVNIGAEARHYRKAGIVLEGSLDGASARPVRETPELRAPAIGSTARDTVLDAISRQLVLRKRPEHPLLVGIDGINASGKTHLARDLAAHMTRSFGMSTQVIHLDDFHFRRATRQSATGGRAFFWKYFDYARLRDLLTRIVRERGARVALSTLNVESDEFTLIRTYDVDASSIVVVEGVFLFREELCDLFDVKIFLDVSLATSVGRVISRRAGKEWFGGVLQKYLDRYLIGHIEYRRVTRPEVLADFILSGDDYQNPRLVQKESCAPEWPLGDPTSFRLST